MTKKRIVGRVNLWAGCYTDIVSEMPPRMLKGVSIWQGLRSDGTTGPCKQCSNCGKVIDPNTHCSCVSIRSK